MAGNIVKCQQCGTALDLSSFEVGQTVACPCGAQLTVPSPQTTPLTGPAVPPLQGQPPPSPQSGSHPSYGAPPPQYGAQPPQYGAPPPQYGGPPMGMPGAHYARGTMPCKEANDALTMAIIGFFCFGIILGPLAIAKASKAQKMIAADPRLAGEGKASAAKVIGIIVTILNAIGIIAGITQGVST